MKSLYTYIQESRGVVTGDDNWSGLVDYIIRNFKVDDNNEFKCNRDYLPNWIYACIIRLVPYTGDIAAYNDADSTLIFDQMDMVINITKKALSNPNRFRSTLEHEFQHAYDDYIGQTRRGRYSFLDDDYCISVGYEGPDFEKLKSWDIIENPKKCYFDHAFFLCKNSTYLFAPTEINAYLREFSLYLKELVGKGEVFDWNKIRTDDTMEGELPLIGMWMIFHMRNHIEDYPGIEWEYVMDSINRYWTTTVLKRKFGGNDAKSFRKVLDEIIRKKIQKPLERYKRVIKDSGVETRNLPDWLK